MKHFVILVYFITLTVGFGGMLLFFLIYLKNRTELIKRYIVFLFLYSAYLIINLFNVYNLTVIENRGISVYIISNVFYFIWFALFIYQIPLFIHGLTGVKMKRSEIAVFLSMSVLTICLLVLPFALKNTGREILDMMRLELMSICYSFFLIALANTIYHLWVYRGKIENEINRKIIKTILLLCIIFLPGFIYDIFLAKYWKKRQIIPLGIDFDLIFYLVWNVISIVYIIQYFITRITIVPDLRISDHFINKYSISIKEKEIVSLIIKGYTNKEIADKLFISSQTVKNHIYNIFQKVSVKSRTELIYHINRYL